jgi:ABC-type transport system involved in multi-copper enzyme maturation permease subunit
VDNFYTTSRYFFLNALRDRLFIGLGILLILIYSVSGIFGSTALVEEGQAIGVFLGGAARILLAIGITVFICISISRSLENKEIDLILSKPISRWQIIIALFASFAFISMVLVALTVGLILFATQGFHPTVLKSGVLVWGLSLFFELMIVSAFAIAASLVLRIGVLSILATLAFYIAGRLAGFFLAAVNSPNLLGNSDVINIGAPILKVLSTILPRLDLFAESSWLIYGNDLAGNGGVFLLQSVVYIPFLLMLAIIDLNRKQF